MAFLAFFCEIITTTCMLMMQESECNSSSLILYCIGLAGKIYFPKGGQVVGWGVPGLLLLGSGGAGNLGAAQSRHHFWTLFSPKPLIHFIQFVAVDKALGHPRVLGSRVYGRKREYPASGFLGALGSPRPPCHLPGME